MPRCIAVAGAFPEGSEGLPVERDSAHEIIRDHQPRRWWALVGLNVCRACVRRWPCTHWHHARDERDRIAREALANEALQMILSLRCEAETAIRSLGRPS